LAAVFISVRAFSERKNFEVMISPPIAGSVIFVLKEQRRSGEEGLLALNWDEPSEGFLENELILVEVLTAFRIC
jgi:hypothetical protein